MKNKYPDGSFYSKLAHGFPEHFTFKINSYEDLWELNQIRDIYKHNNLNATVTIPCLLDAQADKRFDYNESANLKLVCKFINKMKWKKVVIFHPHNPEVVEALIDKVEIQNNLRFITHVCYSLGKLYPARKIDEFVETSKRHYFDKRVEENTILFSTDAGGFKPMMKLADQLNWKGETYSASKSRKFDGEKSTLVQQIDRQNFGGKDILIIDDICVNGGTFIGLANMLKERNCGKLYLAVSHLTVEKPNPVIWGMYERIFTTSSKGLEYFTENGKPINLEIIDSY